MDGGARKCRNCGAAARVQARFCEFCGVELPRSEPAPVGSHSPFGDVESRFAALEGHAEFEHALSHRPQLQEPRALGVLGAVLLAALLLGLAMVLTAGFASFFPPMVVLPLFLVGVLLVSLLGSAFKRGDFERAPLEAQSALIVAERTRITGGREQTAVTKHFATLQFRSGRRQEYEVLDQVSGKLVPGDIGVAYTKARWLVSFSRFLL